MDEVVLADRGTVMASPTMRAVRVHQFGGPEEFNLEVIPRPQPFDSGHAKPTIRRIFVLHEAPQAHTLRETGHGRGRVVLYIADF